MPVQPVHLSCHVGIGACNHPAHTGFWADAAGVCCTKLVSPRRCGDHALELKARLLEHQLHHVKVACQHDLGHANMSRALHQWSCRSSAAVHSSRQITACPTTTRLSVVPAGTAAPHLASQQEHGEVLLCAVTQLCGASSRVNECLCLEGAAECPVKLGFYVCPIMWLTGLHGPTAGDQPQCT